MSIESFRLSPDAREAAELTGSEDEVLHQLHRCVTPQGKVICDKETMAHIRDEFSHCEAFEMYAKYERNAVPTLESMRDHVDRLKIQVDGDPRANDEEKAAMEHARKLIAGSLPSAVSRYVQSVIFYAQQASRFPLMDPEERREFIEKCDGDRRRKHDSLLQTIQEIDVALRLLSEDLGAIDSKEIAWWRAGMEELPHDALPAFDAAAIDTKNTLHRDLIKNWAIAADFAKYFRLPQQQ